jgi:hypothetical protein
MEVTDPLWIIQSNLFVLAILIADSDYSIPVTSNPESRNSFAFLPYPNPGIKIMYKPFCLKSSRAITAEADGSKPHEAPSFLNFESQ